jgi:two-component system response regulator
MQRQANEFDILLVEDNPGDVGLTIEALKDAKIHTRLSFVEDGVEAMAFLRKEGKYSSATRPDVILLDLKLPKKSGREVLAEIKADENLRMIPVVILTGSDAEEDIVKAYTLNASCYIRKPVDMDEFVKVVKSIKDFWFTIVSLPPK